MAQDDVCLQETGNKCAKRMTLLAVTNTKDLEGLQSDGIMGLPPSTEATAVTGSVKTTNFIKTLKD